MATRSRTSKALIVATAALVVIMAVVGVRRMYRPTGLTLITGAVIARNADPHLERPIGNAHLTVTYGSTSWKADSETSGLFRLRPDVSIPADETLMIRVEHPDYLPGAITTTARDQIYVLRLTPRIISEPAPTGRLVTLSNIRVRYATRTTSTSTVGAAVRSFDVVNKGNVACQGQRPCSPDGKWKATTESLTLDAGEDKSFRNVRVSCIAGPCPFSSIEEDRFSRGGRNVSVSVRNWSDPVTYVLEAEVATTMESELIRHTYPVTFDRSMNFTLPAVSTGLTIMAEVDGAEIAFPLGPELRLSWATCRFDTAADGSKQFRCELKPGYQFGQT